MTKKILSLIIGISLMAVSVPVRAEAPLEACEAPEFSFDTINEDVTDVLSFQLAFDTAHQDYHEYMNCVFNTATESLIGTPQDRQSLLTPDDACKAAPELKKVMTDSSPLTLLDPLLAIYYDYAIYLRSAVSLLHDRAQVEAGGRLSDVADAIEKQNELQWITENEIQNALVGLNSAFLSFKELRRAYTMHVHFQCMLGRLDQYRRLMANVRSMVELLPSVIVDASTHK